MAKRKKLIIAAVLAVVLTGTAASALYGKSKPISLEFAQTVTIRSTKEGEDWEAAVTDKEDVRRLIAICGQNEPWPSQDSTSFRCPMYYELAFSGGRKTVRVRPACDDCDPIYIDGKLRKMTNAYTAEKVELREIISKYAQDNRTA